MPEAKPIIPACARIFKGNIDRNRGIFHCMRAVVSGNFREEM